MNKNPPIKSGTMISIVSPSKAPPKELVEVDPVEALFLGTSPGYNVSNSLQYSIDKQLTRADKALELELKEMSSLIVGFLYEIAIEHNKPQVSVKFHSPTKNICFIDIKSLGRSLQVILEDVYIKVRRDNSKPSERLWLEIVQDINWLLGI
jgi:hypothetical protein